MNLIRTLSKSVCISLVLFVSSVYAQKGYPDKPIRMIVPYVAGGAADITARLIAQAMTENMGQSVVVDNKPGANGLIGSDVVAKSAPDGYTLLLTASGPLVVNPVLYKKIRSGIFPQLAWLLVINTLWLFPHHRRFKALPNW